MVPARSSISNHEGNRYLSTTTTYSNKRLARWVAEFQQYHLDLQYRKCAEAVVSDALRRRPDFIGDGPANLADVAEERLVLNAARTVHGVSGRAWLDATIAFLTTGVLPEELSIRRAVRTHAHNVTLDDGTQNPLVYRYDDGHAAPSVGVDDRQDVIWRLHCEYGHLGWPGLRGIMTTQAW